MSQSVILRPDENGNDPFVQLSGRNAQQTILANSIQIRDTATHVFPGNVNGYSGTTLLDVSNFAEKGVLITNQHDQALTVYIFGDVRQSPGNSTTRSVIVSADSLAAGASKWYSSSGYAALKEPLPYLAVQTSASVVPTTGYVSVYTEGGQR